MTADPHQADKDRRPTRQPADPSEHFEDMKRVGQPNTKLNTGCPAVGSWNVQSRRQERAMPRLHQVEQVNLLIAPRHPSTLAVQDQGECDQECKLNSICIAYYLHDLRQGNVRFKAGNFMTDSAESWWLPK